MPSPRDLLAPLDGGHPDMTQIALHRDCETFIAFKDGAPRHFNLRPVTGYEFTATVPMVEYYEADLDRAVLRCIIAAARSRPTGLPALSGGGGSLTPRLSSGAILGAVIASQDTMATYLRRLDGIRASLPHVHGRLPVDEALKVMVEPELLEPGEIIFTGYPKALGVLVVGRKEVYEGGGSPVYGVGGYMGMTRLVPTRYRFHAGVLVYADATERSWLDPPRKMPSTLAEHLDALEAELESEARARDGVRAGKTAWDHLMERDGSFTVPAEENIKAFKDITLRIGNVVFKSEDITFRGRSGF